MKRIHNLDSHELVFHPDSPIQCGHCKMIAKELRVFMQYECVAAPQIMLPLWKCVKAMSEDV